MSYELKCGKIKAVSMLLDPRLRKDDKKGGGKDDGRRCVADSGFFHRR